MHVRPVTLSDVETIKWLGKALAQESPEYKSMTYSPAKVEALVKQAADERVDHVTGWVAETGQGHIAGYILGYTSTNPFFEDVITWDGSMYLQPSYRGKHGRTVIQLVKNYVEWAEQWGGPVKFGLTTDIETDRLERVLHRLGFETTGKVLSYVRRRTEETKTN